MQKDIILSTLNSRYAHTSFGLRYLYANLGKFQEQTKILEFIINKNPEDIVEEILKYNPKIVGFGVYIWNTIQMYEVVSTLKKIAPEIIVVLGGPEISYETENQALTKICDYVIKGEADFLFYEFCEQVLNNIKPQQKIISGEVPNIKEIQLPYRYYSAEDVAHRIIYVEASRGCPYKCEYCLSSLDKSVRNFDVDQFLTEMNTLIEKGVRQFKFVDRTFNLSPSISTKILNFFLERIDLGLFLHFEMVPDRLPDELKILIKQFPKGSLQFEIGIQTLNPEVAKNVSRRQDYEKIKENFHFLNTETGVHTHADLIVGLPGEDLKSFAQGFDELTTYKPDEVQVGILKRLKGTPITRHDQKFSMVYSDVSPFQILRNKDLDYPTLQKMNRFAQYWDLVGNSGNFPKVMSYFKEQGILRYDNSLFALIWDLAEFLFEKHGQAHAISLQNLQKSVVAFLIDRFSFTEDVAMEFVARRVEVQTVAATPKRQQKHL